MGCGTSYEHALFVSHKFEEPLSAEIRGYVKRKKMSHGDLHRQAVYGREAEASAYLIIYQVRFCTFLREEKTQARRESTRTGKQYSKQSCKGSVCRGGHYRVFLNDRVLYSLPVPPAKQIS